MTDNQHDGNENVVQDPNAAGGESTSHEQNMLREKSGEDWGAANTSYVEVINQRKALEEKLNAATAESAQLKTALLGRLSPTATPAEKASAISRLGSEWSLPADLLREAIQEVSGEVFNGYMSPVFSGAQAQQAMVEKYGEGYSTEYFKHVKAVKADPAAQKLFEVLGKEAPLEALEYAKSIYDRGKAVVSNPDPGARNAAAITGGNGAATAGTRNAAGAKKEVDLDALAAKAKAFGRPEIFWTGGALDDIPLTFEERVAFEVNQKKAS